MPDWLIVTIAVVVAVGGECAFIGVVAYLISIINRMDPVGSAREIADRLSQRH